MLHGHRDLKAYQLAYELAMEIFSESKTFPHDERYSLTSQYGVRHAAWPRILRKDIESGSTPTCSSANWQTPAPKQLELRYGSTLRGTAVTYPTKTTSGSRKVMTR
jgi:23S rRNA-intervening sequence protein